jgi:hypothetical protein
VTIPVVLVLCDEAVGRSEGGYLRGRAAALGGEPVDPTSSKWCDVAVVGSSVKTEDDKAVIESLRCAGRTVLYNVESLEAWFADRAREGKIDA